MKRLLIALCAVCCLCGCVTQKSTDSLQKDGIFVREQQIGQEMIEAFQKQNYDNFVKYLPEGGKRVWGKDKFNEEQREVASRLGKIDSYRFLTKLELEPAHHLVWVVRFKSYTLKGEETFKEALFSIVVGQVDENLKVFLFGFK
ncbi:MAG: hypothetical protein E7058_03915 [Lentisphaerae bacterium]|nr:hypothetical protein [Lentisphaerota bacterium]